MNLAGIFQQSGVLLLLAFLLGWILTRIFPDVLAFALAGLGLSSFLPAYSQWQYTCIIFLYWVLVIAAYLVGNAFPWRRLEVVRGKIGKLFGSVAGSYVVLLGVVILAAWRMNVLDLWEPWLIYFTLAFGLISYNEPWRRMLTIPTRGPLSLVLPQLGALSCFVSLFIACIYFEEPKIMQSILLSVIFFGIWWGFIRLAKIAPGTILARVLQLGLLCAVNVWGASVIVCALVLGLLNSLAGLKVLDTKFKVEIWRILNAAVILLVFSSGLLQFNLNVLAAVAAVLVLRFIIFYAYNLYARVYLFGTDFVRRINFGLQVSDSLLILMLWIFAAPPLILTTAVLVMLLEQLFYPSILKNILVQSGETEA